jgi:SSS family solute:Na+ symporter
MLIPLAMRWYYWRINGYGYGLGIISGVIVAIIQRFAFPQLPDYFSFLAVSAFSFFVTLIVSLITPKTPMKVLLKL